MNNAVYQEILRQMTEAKQRQEQNNSLNNIRSYASKINKYGQNMSNAGNFLKGHIDNGLTNSIASKMQGVGNVLQNGSSKVLNTLNAPQNYFRGVAAKPFEALASKVGTVGTTGASLGSSAVGNALANGATTGIGSTALGSSLAGATGGTAAGMGAAGATSALSGATAGATAAGSGAAAGGAAAAGPIGALIALGITALQGTNRKRAKQSGQALLKSTDNIAQQANEQAYNDLMATQQSTQDLQRQAAENLSKGISTGGAAGVSGTLPDLSNIPAQPTLQSGNQISDPNAPKLQPLDQILVNYSNNPDIASYQKSLYQQGINPDIINGVPQGLNGGNQDIAEWQKQFLSGAGRNSGFKIPQTEDEIKAAQAGTFNSFADNSGEMQQGAVAQNVKRGLLDKFASGLTDFARGFKENSQNGFSPENLSAKQFTETTTQLAPSQALTNYQNELRNKGYSDDVINAVAEGKNNGNKDIADWIANNQNALKPETVLSTQYYDKHKMGRLGEAAGTLSRVLKNPNAQGLVAGLAGTVLTGNPLYGLGLGYKFANQRNLNNIYQKALRDQGIDTPEMTLGNISGSDFNTLMTPQYKQWDRGF